MSEDEIRTRAIAWVTSLLKKERKITYAAQKAMMKQLGGPIINRILLEENAKFEAAEQMLADPIFGQFA